MLNIAKYSQVWVWKCETKALPLLAVHVSKGDKCSYRLAKHDDAIFSARDRVCNAACHGEFDDLVGSASNDWLNILNFIFFFSLHFAHLHYISSVHQGQV